MRSKGFTLVEIVVVICVIGIVAAVGYVWWQNQTLKDQTNVTSVGNSSLVGDNASVNTEWKVYNNARKQYSFSYPPQWSVINGEVDQHYETVILVDQDGGKLIEFDTIVSADCRFDTGEPVSREQLEQDRRRLLSQTRTIQFYLGDNETNVSNYCGNEKMYFLNIVYDGYQDSPGSSAHISFQDALDTSSGTFNQKYEQDLRKVLHSVKGVTPEYNAEFYTYNWLLEQSNE